MKFVYVSCAGSGEILVFRLEDDGSLTPAQSLALGGTVMPLALDPARRFLYAARRSAPLAVLSFAVDPGDGRLTALGVAPLPHSMANLATDRRGRFLFSASYGGNLVAVGPIDADGVAREAHQVVATGPGAHAVHADPGNRFVFATSLGGGVVHQFRFDETTGRLAANDPPRFAPHPNASPRHLVFAADGRTAWLLGERDGVVDVLALDPDTGRLRTVQSVSSLPPGFAGDAWAADLHATPDGRFLFCSERRGSTLATFRVDPDSGRLTLIGRMPTEAQPRGFAVAPDGGHLVVAGETSNHFAVYAVDAGTGALALRSRQPAGVGPNWVEIAVLPSAPPPSPRAPRAGVRGC